MLFSSVTSHSVVWRIEDPAILLRVSLTQQNNSSVKPRSRSCGMADIIRQISFLISCIETNLETKMKFACEKPNAIAYYSRVVLANAYNISDYRI